MTAPIPPQRQLACPDERGQLNYYRAHLDGLPTRSQGPVLLNEDEFDERMQPYAKFEFAEFDLENPTHAAAYRRVCEGIANKQLQMMYIDRKYRDIPTLRYVEWLIVALEDTKG